MGTKDTADIALLKKLAAKTGYAIVRKKKPNRTLTSELLWLVGVAMKGYTDNGGVEGKILNKKAFTSRHYVLKAAKDKRLNKILDAHFKGKKRKEFDDKSDKKYNTAKTLHQDIAHVGLYKRYKLIERNYNKYFNKETFKIMFDSDYFPKQKDKK